MARGVEQRAEQRRSQDRLLLRQRVLEHDDLAQRVSLRHQQAVEQTLIGEAPAGDLAQPAADERVLGAAPHALGVREPPGGAPPRRERGGQALEPVDPRDLLDQVDLPRHVAAAQRGHRRVEPARGGCGPEVERAQDLVLVLARDRHAEDRLDAALAQPDRRGRRALAADVDGAGQKARPAQLEHQLGGERLRVHALLGLQALLEAPRGLAAQAERPRGAVDARAAPRRDLHQHARRRGLDLRARAAHDPGDRGRPVGVVDHDHLAVERAGLPVERLHLLALARATHDQLAAGDAVEVERVQRLAAQQHRVVGDVDDVVDRPLPGGRQSALSATAARARS